MPQKTVIPFEYVHFGSKIHLILYPFVENLTTYITILDMQDITDEQVKELIKRCNKITEFILNSQSITNETVTNIIEHLPTLKKLTLINHEIDCASFLKFKRMPNLFVLNWGRDNTLDLGIEPRHYDKKYLQTQGLIINQYRFNVAAAQVLMDLPYCKNRVTLEKQCKNEIWEIQVKQLQMLPFYQPNRI